MVTDLFALTALAWSPALPELLFDGDQHIRAAMAARHAAAVADRP